MMARLALLLHAAAAESCSLKRIDGAPTNRCVQWDLSCSLASHALQSEPRLSNGTCADLGYTLEDNAPRTSLRGGQPLVTTFAKPLSDAVPMVNGTCPLRSADGGLADNCVQWDVECAWVNYMMESEPRMHNGSCAAVGYPMAGNRTTENNALAGKIIITHYIEWSLAVNVTCPLHGVDGELAENCVEWGVECALVDYMMELEPRMQNGSCASAGYPTASKTTARYHPLTGEVMITDYSKQRPLLAGVEHAPVNHSNMV